MNVGPEAEEAIRCLVEALPFYVMVIDQSHRILIANREIVKASGLSASQLRGAFCPKVIHGTDEPFPGCPLEEAVCHGRAVSKEFFLADEGRWIRTEVFPFSLPGESEVVYLHIAQDITEFKASQVREQHGADMLRVNNELLIAAQTIPSTSALLERALDLVLALPWLSFEGRGAVFLVAESGKQLELVAQRGLAIEIRTSCRKVPVGICLCGRAAASGECVHAARLDDRHDMTYAGIEDHGHYCVPIASNGRTLGVLNIYLRPGHPRVEAEIAFLEGVASTLGTIVSNRRSREDRHRLAAMLDATTDLVGIASPEGRVQYINAAGRRMLGIELNEDIRGTPIASFHTASAAEVVRDKAIPHAIEHGTWCGDTFLVTRDGLVIPISQVVLAHRRPDGTLDYLSTIARDISAQKRLEEQLRQSQKLDAIGKLASGVAHDFNNLLSIIKGSAGFLLEDLTEPRCREDAAEILEAANRAAGLTRQLLAFSRDEKIEPGIIDVNGAVRNLARMLRRLIGEHITLNLRLGDDAGFTFIDPAQLEQVLVNLVVNARDAMPGGGRVTLTTARVDVDADAARLMPGIEPGAHVAIDVADTGVGMTPDVLDRIFDPFFTTKPVGMGTGLGLSMVYGAIKQNGGHVCVESKPGGETTFRIVLRQVEAGPVVSMGKESFWPPHQGTVLLVEDDVGVRRVVAKLLVSLGYDIIEAFDGEEAVRLFEAVGHRITVVVSDVVMPVMGGVDMARRLAAVRGDLGIVFMSGYVEGFGEVEEIEGVRSVLIRKPVDREALAKALRDVLT
jgi:PAS domain S-box-containing protein